MQKIMNMMFLCCALSSNIIVANKLLQPVSIGRVKQVLNMFKRCPNSVVKDNVINQPSDKDLMWCMRGMVKEIRNLDNGRRANYPNGILWPLVDLEDKKLKEIYVKFIKEHDSENK